MKWIAVVLAAVIVSASFLTGITISQTSQPSYDAPGPVKLRQVAYANQDPAYYDLSFEGTGGAWMSLSIPMVITVSGSAFYVSGNCEATNSVTSPDGLAGWFQWAIFADGVYHNEAQAQYYPVSRWTYYSGEAGSLIEGPTGQPGTHTFEIKVRGLRGEFVSSQCNLNVLAWQ